MKRVVRRPVFQRVPRDYYAVVSYVLTLYFPNAFAFEKIARNADRMPATSEPQFAGTKHKIGHKVFTSRHHTASAA